MVASRTSVFSSLVAVISTAVMFADTAAVQAQSITWNVSSPTAIGGGRFSAVGSYTLPANQGATTYELVSIVVRHRKPPAVNWDVFDAIPHLPTKTWSYTNSAPLNAPLTIEVMARMKYKKTVAGMMPVVTFHEVDTIIKTLLVN